MDIIKGLIYGCAIADALGVQAESLDKEELSRRYPYGIKDFGFNSIRGIYCGDWTDDTDQLILLMESLCRGSKGKIKFNELAFAKKIKYWRDHGFSELGDLAGMGLGQLTAKVISNDKFLTTPYIASKEVHQLLPDRIPNGGVMRTAICGLFPNWYTLSESQCKTTHYHPECVISCQFVCWMIRQCIKKHFNKKYKMKNPIKFIDKYVDLTHQEKIRNYVVDNLDELKLDERHTWGYTYKALGCGIWTYNQIRKNNTNYESITLQIINQAGDADTNAAVSGSIIGCYLGYNKLPKKWLDKLIHKKWLDNKINSFVENIVTGVY
jgi:hypothetical protein